MPGDVLDLIDGTLRDNREVAADAMRWTPDPGVRASEDKRGANVTFAVTADLTQLYAAMAELGRALISAASQIAEDPFVKAFARLAERIAHDQDAIERPRWHVRRCTTCNPACANTTPWGAAGHEYHRRRKARARRSRRR